MFRRIMVGPFAGLALFAGGCGTLVNHSEPGPILNANGYTPYRPYGGVLVSADAALIGAGRTVNEGEIYDRVSTAAFAAGFLFIDLPLSAIADTILLPLDVVYTLQGKGHPEGGWPWINNGLKLTQGEDKPQPPATASPSP
jgi:uncharacterized protein YceK